MNSESKIFLINSRVHYPSRPLYIPNYTFHYNNIHVVITIMASDTTDTSLQVPETERLLIPQPLSNLPSAEIPTSSGLEPSMYMVANAASSSVTIQVEDLYVVEPLAQIEDLYVVEPPEGGLSHKSYVLNFFFFFFLLTNFRLVNDASNISTENPIVCYCNQCRKGIRSGMTYKCKLA